MDKGTQSLTSGSSRCEETRQADLQPQLLPSPAAPLLPKSPDFWGRGAEILKDEDERSLAWGPFSSTLQGELQTRATGESCASCGFRSGLPEPGLLSGLTRRLPTHSEPAPSPGLPVPAQGGSEG